MTWFVLVRVNSCDFVDRPCRRHADDPRKHTNQHETVIRVFARTFVVVLQALYATEFNKTFYG